MIPDNNQLRILHSFPKENLVFKKFCELTFKIDGVNNTYVDQLAECNNSLDDYDLLVVHYLRDSDCSFMESKKIETPSVLFSWGADLFNLGKFYNQFLLPKTFKLRSSLYSEFSVFVQSKKRLHTWFPSLLDLRSKNKRRLKVLSRFNAIVPVMPGDYHLLKNQYRINGFLHHLNYVNPNLEEGKIEIANGDFILLGNAASFTNNHLEAIDKLVDLIPTNKTLLIPLSYGNTYLSKYIEQYALEKLGSKRTKPLLDFLPAHQYQALLNKCEIVVMNHLRQQAVGNIVQALAIGSHIYMQSSSPVYKYLKSHKFYVSAFDESTSLCPLNSDERSFNFKKTVEIFGKELQHKRLIMLIEKLTGRKLKYKY